MKHEINDMDYKPKTLEEIKQFYWHWYPHEITFFELKEINPELYCKLKNYEQVLKLLNSH